MEEDQEMRHICKFCSKKFPCGRSLGGHMRSHLMNSAEPDEKLNPKKLPSVGLGGSNGDKGKSNEADAQSACRLRENPKKTSKFSKSIGDTLLPNKLCKECGKGFQSWRALFGHMKCHSEKVPHSVKEEDSWGGSNHKLNTDSQSDTEAASPNRKKRSRRIKKCTAASAATSSLTIGNTSPARVFDVEKEQEEVAMSLILLSRDVGNWDGLNSSGESSGNNSECLESRSSSQTNRIAKAEGKSAKCNGDGSVKLNILKPGKLESVILASGKTEFEPKAASGIPRNGLKMKKPEVQHHGILLDCKLKKIGIGFEGSEVELAKNSKESGIDQPAESDIKRNPSRKRKVTTDQHSTFDYQSCEGLEKKSQFECTACNKTFHSYQALGGHRASHKKLKSCFASKIDSSENSTETDLFPNQTADSKLIKSYSYDNINYKFTNKFEMDHESKKSTKVHECPICFRVFPSGQALGGHKRSHLIAEAKSNKSVMIQKPIPEVRDFLDLNLPPPAEEESSDPIGFQPWWIGSNHEHDHNQQQLVGLLSH